MKVLVCLEGQSYEVEVGDLSALPIVAVVDGRRFEVWPSGEATTPGDAASQCADRSPAPGGRPPSLAAVEGEGPVGEEKDTAGAPSEGATSLRRVSAPIPGVVESVAVRAGDRVARGDQMMVLEAMKMKNAIRAPRPGVIVAVHVTAGQHVKHNDPLVEYRD